MVFIVEDSCQASRILQTILFEKILKFIFNKFCIIEENKRSKINSRTVQSQSEFCLIHKRFVSLGETFFNGTPERYEIL